MYVAFYAPMKAPDHPVPSGDRRMAQLLVRALRLAGHRVSIASRLRSYDGAGDAAAQRRIRASAQRIAARYATRRQDPPDLWFTYHCYHKAPDHIGPRVADALGIPFVVADASVAPKQAAGRWAAGYTAANAAVLRADRLIVFDPLDLACVAALRAGQEDIVSLPPLVDRAPACAAARTAARRNLAAALGLDPSIPWLAATAMMRPGAKCRSYRVLARALRRITDRPWALVVAGDGAARSEVEAFFAGLDRVRFLGQLDEAAVRRLHLAADLAVWPAVDESYCMALVEAQAAGVPAVAGDRPGVAAVIDAGTTGLLTPEGDDAAFAQAVASLIDEPARRGAMASAAARAADRFDLHRAAGRLDAVLISARENVMGRP
jgi:glycosyltransferase involved in cell wall biosynthesis